MSIQSSTPCKTAMNLFIAQAKRDEHRPGIVSANEVFTRYVVPGIPGDEAADSWLFLSAERVQQMDEKDVVALLDRIEQDYCALQLHSIPCARLLKEDRYVEEGGLCFEHNEPLPEVLTEDLRKQITKIIERCLFRSLFPRLDKTNFGLRGRDVVLLNPLLLEKSAWEQALPQWLAPFTN